MTKPVKPTAPSAWKGSVEVARLRPAGRATRRTGDTPMQQVAGVETKPLPARPRLPA